MTRKQKRTTMILSGLALLGLAAGLILFALSDAIVFFHTPSEVAQKNIAPGVRFRLGGLVAEGSIKKLPDSRHEFTVTDTDETLKVVYQGNLPDLFREGQGVVAEGAIITGGVFEADTVLAKHDENYMPREVVDALKKKGVWKNGREKSQ